MDESVYGLYSLKKVVNNYSKRLITDSNQWIISMFPIC